MVERHARRGHLPRTARRAALLGHLFLCAVLWAAPARAQGDWPRVELSGGGLVAAFDTSVRLDDVRGIEGTTVDFEDDLGLDTRSGTWFVQGLWRISRRNQLSASYQGFSRELSRTILDREIRFGDRTFGVGAEVGAIVEAQYVSIDYGFAFVATPRVEFGASIGVTAVRLQSGIEATAGVSGSSSSGRTVSSQLDYDLPIPLPGLFVNARVHPRVTVRASTRGLKGAIDEYSAALAEARAGLDVRLAGPLSVGGAYYFNRARVTRRETRTDGQIVYRFQGPIVYGNLAW
ncbi:hypothetical protein TBR22_A43050 [Luteitalea sp. TBR-22]|uniref:hypothetical protein n=1 Tax=Luteitalea sp. TBR-22 TaxID=2802971 RepID=UPI001AF17C2C|nr:hypothetical protein [Luteitalea sp. TBR-22]BCS35079.1 hypothetical protein TBR22_A43050 [Luteitalea sp. TBR-22]